MASEPNSLLISLYALVLEHKTPAKGNHDAADACKYAVTRECEFKIFVASKEDANESEFTEVTPTPIPADPNNPMTPSALAVLPFNGTPPLILKIVATPTKKVTIRSAHGETVSPGVLREVQDVKTEEGYFSATGFFTYKGAGVWEKKQLSQLEEEENCATHFSNPVVFAGTQPVPFTFSVISFFLSRVRDRTIKARKSIDAAAEKRDDWLQQAIEMKSLHDPPVEKGKVVFATAEIELDADFRVLEVKGFNGPSLLAVTWPRQNNKQSAGPTTAPGFRADPMESFIFFHASYNQNAKIYTKNPYPFGLEYISFGIDNYLTPTTDPLDQAYPLSLPYQIEAANKQTVLILPVNRVGFPELPNLNFPEQVVELLEEIHAAFLRFADFYYWLPNVGRLGIGSFSAAIQELLLFKRGAVSHPLLKSLLQEIVIFDPVHDNASKVAEYGNGLKQWAGNVPERRVRMYNNESGADHATFLGVSSLPASPYVMDSKDGRFTAGVVSDTDWLTAFTNGSGHRAFTTPLFKDIYRTTLTKEGTKGDVEIEVESTTGLHPNELLVVNLFVYRVTATSGKTIKLARPLEDDCEKGRIIGRCEAKNFKTHFAEDAASGVSKIKVVSADGLATDDRVFMGETEIRAITAVEGNELSLNESLKLPKKQGDEVNKFIARVETNLASDVTAGAKTINVITPRVSGFVAGDIIGIGSSDFPKVVSVTDTTLTLDTPLKSDHAKGELVVKSVPRRFEWGTYHAMFVSVFFTDFFRKSGFR